MIAVSVVTAWIATMRMPNIYEASTTILVQNSRSSAERLLLEGLQGASGNQLQHYVEILRSRTLAQRAAATLGYHWDLDAPELTQFRQSITVQPVSGTEAIRISVQSKDPVQAANIANAMANAFIEFNSEMNRTEASRARVFIEEQLRLIENQLREAETALQQYRVEERVLSPSEETRILLSQAADLAVQHAETQLAYEKAKNLLADIRAGVSSSEDLQLILSAVPGSAAIHSLRATIMSLETELAGLRNQYSEQHPQVASQKAKIAEAERQLAREAVQVVEAQVAEYETLLKSLESQIDVTEQRLNELPEKELVLARLMRDQTITEQVYLLLRSKYEEVRITEAMTIADVMIVDPSIVPDKPVKPRKGLNIAIAGFLGLFLGIGLAFVLEFLDTSLKSAEEAEAVLDLPVMGRIPYQADWIHDN